MFVYFPKHALNSEGYLIGFRFLGKTQIIVVSDVISKFCECENFKKVFYSVCDEFNVKNKSIQVLGKKYKNNKESQLDENSNFEISKSNLQIIEQNGILKCASKKNSENDIKPKIFFYYNSENFQLEKSDLRNETFNSDFDPNWIKIASIASQRYKNSKRTQKIAFLKMFLILYMNLILLLYRFSTLFLPQFLNRLNVQSYTHSFISKRLTQIRQIKSKLRENLYLGRKDKEFITTLLVDFFLTTTVIFCLLTSKSFHFHTKALKSLNLMMHKLSKSVLVETFKFAEKLKFNGNLNLFISNYLNVFADKNFNIIDYFLCSFQNVFSIFLAFALICGLSISFSVSLDLLRILSFPLIFVSQKYGKVTSGCFEGLSVFWKLFCGKKRNVLSGKTDFCQYQIDQIILSTVFFTLLIFTIPAIFAYQIYLVFLRIIVLIAISIFYIVFVVLKSFPIFSVFDCLFNRKCIRCTDFAYKPLEITDFTYSSDLHFEFVGKKDFSLVFKEFSTEIGNVKKLWGK